MRRERRHLILQLRELVRDVERHEVAPRGEHLAELDVDRPEGLERLTQPHAARAAWNSRQVMQPVPQADEEDAGVMEAYEPNSE